MALEEKILRVLKQYDVFGHTVSPEPARVGALAELVDDLARLGLGAAHGTMEEDANRYLSQLIDDHEQGLVTKWVLLIETIAPDGSTGMWCKAREGMHAWDTIGALQYGLMIEQALINDTFGDDN